MQYVSVLAVIVLLHRGVLEHPEHPSGYTTDIYLPITGFAHVWSARQETCMHACMIKKFHRWMKIVSNT